MLKIVMCGHGHLASAMKKSIKMIYGEVDHLISLDFNNHENRETLVQKFTHVINAQEQYLIIVDLFGGSPYNAAAELAFKNENIELISGMSLPLCLELIDKCDMPLNHLADYLVEAGKSYVKKLDKTIKKFDEEDELL